MKSSTFSSGLMILLSIAHLTHQFPERVLIKNNDALSDKESCLTIDDSGDVTTGPCETADPEENEWGVGFSTPLVQIGYPIKNIAKGKCLQCGRHGVVSAEHCEELLPPKSQLWIVTKHEQQIVNRFISVIGLHEESRCLAVLRGSVTCVKCCRNDKNQEWSFKDVDG